MRAALAITLLALLCAGVSLASAEVTRANLRYIQYPEFPEAHSTWGSIGYSRAYHRVFAGVTNHRDRVGLFEFNIAADSIRLLGFLPELAHLRPWQWQGKVHSQLVEGPDSAMYFSTDGGEVRTLYLMNHPGGYNGGNFYRWHIGQERLEPLAQVMPFESAKDMIVSRVSGKILATTFTQVHLLLFDPASGVVDDLGRVGSAHVPRVLFSDRWGNMYYVDWQQRLIKYEHDTGKLLFAETGLPKFEGTGGYSIITGITAWAEDEKTGTIYLVTYGSKLVAFHPQRLGLGMWEDLGGVFDGDREPWSYYCPNLALGHNGKLYYFIGGHGNYAVKDRTVLMEFDPATRTKRLLLEFPLEEINEVTGANITDRDGNMYFLGRGEYRGAAMMGESGASRPFMIKFNPEQVVNP